jgi:hypothetical protein
MTRQGSGPGGRVWPRWGSFTGHVLSSGHLGARILPELNRRCQTRSMNSLTSHLRSKSMNRCPKISGIECARARGGVGRVSNAMLAGIGAAVWNRAVRGGDWVS